MKKIFVPLILAMSCQLAFAGDSSSVEKSSTQASSKSPQEMTPEERLEKFKKENDIRISAIKQYYMERGLSEGRVLMFQARKKDLLALKPYLDKIYDTSHLYLENGKLQPPVVLKGEDLFEIQPTGQSYKESQVRYQLAAPERYVTSQLNWETYLISDDDLEYNGPAPESFLSPRNENEKFVANQYYEIGVKEGANQVELELGYRVKSLTTLIKGMYYFYNAYPRGLLSMPKTVKTYIPVSGNQTQLTLATEENSIVDPAKFELDPNNYMAIVGSPVTNNKPSVRNER